MRVYYDTEFLEDGRTIELISIGMAAEDGRELYLVSQEAPWPAIYEHPWLMANVVPQLLRSPLGRDLDIDVVVRPRATIAARVLEFLRASGPSAELQLWADYAAYDHVALAQLWGPMIDLPPGVPMFTHELQQDIEITELVNRISGTETRGPRPVQTDGLHNALGDARHGYRLGRWVGHS
jgi:hypothetical protein